LHPVINQSLGFFKSSFCRRWDSAFECSLLHSGMLDDVAICVRGVLWLRAIMTVVNGSIRIRLIGQM